MAQAPATMADQGIPRHQNSRLSTTQHRPTTPYRAESSTATSLWFTGSTSRRSTGKLGGMVVSTGHTGLTTGVWHRGQRAASLSSSTPQLTQYDMA